MGRTVGASGTTLDMKIGLMAPQGWKGEYDRWDPSRAWARTVELAVEAEELGYEALWAFDHFHTVPEPRDQITFESFSVLAALAALTKRVRIGQLVVCAGFRNPALTAKVASTIDVISGGRFELGMGAGWKEDEWLAYGYAFPPIGRRLAVLADQLEVVSRMLEPGRATYEGRYAHVREAINEPRGMQSPRIPLIVGGNGEKVTWALAARFADELNLVYLDPEAVADAMPVIRRRCEAAQRDPATLHVSAYIPDQLVSVPGPARADLLGRYAELGLSRVVAFLPRSPYDRDAQARLAEDAREAGLDMAEPSGRLAGVPAFELQRELAGAFPLG